jgi:hypothetical protein
VSLRIDWNNCEISIDRFWSNAKLLGGGFEARRTIFSPDTTISDFGDRTN